MRHQAQIAAAATLAASLALLAWTGPAVGSHPGGKLPASKVGERKLRTLEERMLGSEHAAEHARARRLQLAELRRWRAMTPGEREQELAREEAEQSRLELMAGPPSQDGAWTTAPFRLPNYAIHSVVLPTGKVLFWGYPPFGADGRRPNEGRAAIWTPWKGKGAGAFKVVNPPLIDVDGDGDREPAPIYCSGQSYTPSGAVLIAGGNYLWPSEPGDPYSRESGMNRVYTFNPFKERWVTQPSMRKGRWYPSQVEMADGRTLLVSGYTEDAPGAVYNTDLEIFDPADAPGGVGTTTQIGTKQASLYPHLFTLPNGNVFLAGSGDTEPAILRTSNFTWQDVDNLSVDRDASSAVLLPGGPSGSTRFGIFGGYDFDVQHPTDGSPAQRTTETIDVANPSTASWQPGPDLSHPRSTQNTVLLPDGSMLAVGGGRGWRADSGAYLTNNDGRLRQLEIFDPEANSWRLGPPQQEDRAYHSTAVLLPDGRVMSAGDDYHPTIQGSDGPTFAVFDTAEIYSPPYLFQGSRPAIKKAPKSARWGDAFGVRTPSANIDRAVLMAPAATTHAVDMNQRHVELRIERTVSGKGVDVVAPPRPGVAPPGYYMLFLLNRAGIPSVAKWVHITDEAPDQPRLGQRPRLRVRIRSGARMLRRKGIVIARVRSNLPVALRLGIAVGGDKNSKRRSGLKRVHTLAFRFPPSARTGLGVNPALLIRARATTVLGDTTRKRRVARL